MSQFLTRAAFAQFSPTPAQLPFSQFGVPVQTPTREQAGVGGPAITAEQQPQPKTQQQQQPQPIFQNPFSPNEQQILAQRNMPGLFGPAIF